MITPHRTLLFALIMALLFIFALSYAAHAQTDCYPIAPSGEGFPRIYCPLTDQVWYQDMDGIDGALGTEGDGEWKEEGR